MYEVELPPLTDCIPYHRHGFDKRRQRKTAASVTRTVDGVKRTRAAYVWAWIEANGRDPKPKHVIRHTCGNCNCVNPDHLVEGTYKENYADRHKLGEYTGRPPYRRGSDVNTAKLDEFQVRVIRQLNAEGMTYGQIAERYGVTRQMIGCICRGTSWKWVE